MAHDRAREQMSRDEERQHASARPPRDLAAALAAAERRALIAESRHDALLRAVGESTWIANASGQVQREHPVGLGFARARPESAETRTWIDAIHPDDRATVLAAWEHAVASETPLVTSGRIGRADGTYRIMLIRAAPARDQAGTIREWVGVTRDVTERRQARTEALARADLLEATIEAMVDAVVICDAEGRLLHANAAFRTLLRTHLDAGYDERPLVERMRLVGISTAEGTPLPAMDWPLARLLRGETLSDETARDFLVHTLDGGAVVLSVTGAPVRDAQGAITGAVAIYRDVTERRRLERRAREALDALLAMAETLISVPVAPAEVPPAPAEDAPASPGPPGASDAARRLAELTVDVLNCRYVSILSMVPALSPARPPRDAAVTAHGVAVAGLTSEQAEEWWSRYAPGVPLSVLADDEQVERLAAGEVFVAKVRSPRHSGAAFGVQTLLWVPLRVGAQVVGVLAVDYGARHQPTDDECALAEACGRLVALVVERERLLSERAEAQASALALREANRRLDEFLSVASHELRTPLTSIKAYLQLAQRRTDRLADDAALSHLGNARDVADLATLLRRTGAAVERQNRLVSDLLDVSRIHAGKLEMRPESLDLGAVVLDAVEEQRLAHPDRTIALTLPPDPVSVVADGERIRQVIANYLTNALKYSEPEKPVAVELRTEAAQAWVAVRDHGQGIPAAELDQVWERFHRVPGTSHLSGSGVGLGLGLFISRQIVERHGGDVGVASTPGAGSEFWFTLPIESPAQS